MTARKNHYGKILLLLTIIGLMGCLLTACFVSDTVIKFESNGGSPCESILVTDDVTSITLPTPTKNGYVFDGWYSNRALTKPLDAVISGDNIPTSSVTYYAKWLTQRITFTYTAGGAVVDTQTYDYGTIINRSDFPSLDNFPGYEWDASITTLKAMYDRTVSAVAIQVDDPEYVVAYYVPDDSGFILYDEQKGKQGAVIGVPENPSPLVSTGASYFAGWYYDSAYTLPCNEEPTVIGESNITLYAKFDVAGDDSKFLFYEETANGDVAIIGLTVVGGYQSSISIPSTIDGKTVVAIGSGLLSSDGKGSLGSEFIERIILPETVTEIKNYAFCGSSALKEIIFVGDAVTSIGKGAFAGCVSLTKINIPSNLTSIGDFAFAGISKTGETDVTLDGLDGEWKTVEMGLSALEITKDSKLSSLGDYAFFGCNNLKSATFGTTIRDINYLAFLGSGIQNIDFYDGANLKSVDGAVYSKTGATLQYYPIRGQEQLLLAETVTAIADNAFFNNENIKNLVVLGNLRTIGNNAFNGCVNLATVDIANSTLTTVGDDAFNGCVSLTKIIFPTTLENMGKRVFNECTSLSVVEFKGSLLSGIGDGAFNNCVSLGAISIPENVAYIGESAFAWCDSLSSVVFSGRSVLTTIDDYAFYESKLIGSVFLPSSITYIGKYAFASEIGKMNLEVDTDSDLSNVNYLGDYAFMNTQVASFTISGKIATDGNLGKYVFKNCTSLSQAYLSPAGFTTLSEGLFYGCTALSRINFSNNIVAVGKYAFYNCVSLEWVGFGSNVERIEEGAFSGCITLANLGGTQRILPEELTYLGERAFYNCKSLEAVNIPVGITKIEKETFAYCSSLTAINYDVGTTLNTIGENAFAYCTALATALLPATLADRNDDDTVGLVKNPFYGCTSLKEYKFTDDTSYNTPTASGLFAEDGVVYRKLSKYAVPTEYATERAIYAYPTAKSSASFSVPTTVAVIDRYAFYGCTVKGLSFARNTSIAGTENVVLVKIGDYAFSQTQITEITLSFRVYHVGEGAFRNSAVNKITVDGTYIDNTTSGYSIINTDVNNENNLLSIGSYALANTSISSFVAPSRTTVLGEGALSNDYALSSVTFDGGDVTGLVLGDRLFEGDNLISTITIPYSVTEIGSYAFYRCGNLEQITFLSGNGQGLVVGDYAFAGVQRLYEITLPSTLVSLGEGIFDGDTRLKYVNFPETLTVASEIEIPDYAFREMPTLVEFTVPEYVSKIGDGAFNGTSLQKITFLGDTTSTDLVIGNNVFASLSGLSSITLPANLVEIGDYAFLDSGLEEISCSDGKTFTVGVGAFKNTKITEFTATDRITAIGEESFANISSLTSFSSAVLTDIPAYAFYGNANLTNVSLGDQVVSVGDSAFFGTGITEFISTSVRKVGEYSFANSLLEQVSIASSNELIVSDNAFYGATKLATAILIATDDLTVGKGALGDCAVLTTLALEGNSVSLTSGFAMGASSLGDGFTLVENGDKNYDFDVDTHVVYSSDGQIFVYYPAGKVGSTFSLKDTVKEIADYAFCANSGLTGIIVNGSDVVIWENSFANTSEDLVFYVPKDTVSAYLNVWKMDNVSSQTTVADGLVLTKQSSGDYKVTGYLGDKADVVINGEITEENVTYVITAVGENAFRNNTVITTLTIGNGIKSIESGAFRNCSNLTSVSIGENVTSVKSYAFYGCNNITAVNFSEDSGLISIGNYAFAHNTSISEFTIPDGVESIGIFAFSGCVNLSKLTIGQGVSEIGNNAFENCYAMQNVVLPQNLVKMGSYVFSGCDNLVYVDVLNTQVCEIESNTFVGIPESVYFFVPDTASERLYKADGVWRTYISKILSATQRRAEQGFENYVLKSDGGEYELIAYLGTEENVVIKSTVSENVVITSIGEYAIGKFARYVTVEEGIVEIKERAFSHAQEIVGVVMPYSLEVIGNYAFAYLTKLESATIQGTEGKSSLTAINNYAFYGCTALASFSFPQSVRSIGNYAFASETTQSVALANIVFEHNAISGTNEDGESVYVSIGNYAFSGNETVTEITFNCKVSSLGKGAFANCENLSGIYFNYNPRTTADTVISVDSDGAFTSCDKLSVFVPSTTISNLFKNSWTNAYDKHKVSAVGYKDSDGFVYTVTSTQNKEVTLINYLGDKTEIEFPSQTQIGQEIYRVVRIGREKYGDLTQHNGYVIGNNVVKVTIPSSVKTIGEDAFRNCESLKEVVLGNSVVTIESYAFAGCKALQNINIPISVIEILSYAFYDCDSLNTGLKFSESIMPPTEPTMTIGGYAFAECDSLESFYVTNNVKLIGGIRSSSSSVYGYTFENCKNLKTIEFSKDAQITSIERYVFAETAIEELTLPSSVETVADYALAKMHSLKRVVITRDLSTITSATDNTFSETENVHLKVYVPENAYATYAVASGWRNKTVVKNVITTDGLFAYEISGSGTSASAIITDYRGAEEVVTIPRVITVQSNDYYVTGLGAYFANDTVKKIVFSDNSMLTSIASNAFRGCTALDEIHLPDNVTSLGDRAFYECVNLTDVVLPAKLTEIKEFTFYGCTSLSEIVLPSEIQSIGPSAFYKCTNLARVTVKFGKNVTEGNVGTTIGTSAFGETGQSSGGLTIIVPSDKYAVFRAGWTASVGDVIYSETEVVGDFVVRINERGTALSVVQYLGDASVVDFTALTLMGYYVEEIEENAIKSEKTQFIVGENVIFPEEIADRVTVIE